MTYIHYSTADLGNLFALDLFPCGYLSRSKWNGFKYTCRCLQDWKKTPKNQFVLFGHRSEKGAFQTRSLTASHSIVASGGTAVAVVSGGTAVAVVLCGLTNSYTYQHAANELLLQIRTWRIFFINFVPLWNIILITDTLLPPGTTDFISPFNTCYIFRPLLTILSFKCHIFKYMIFETQTLTIGDFPQIIYIYIYIYICVCVCVCVCV